MKKIIFVNLIILFQAFGENWYDHVYKLPSINTGVISFERTHFIGNYSNRYSNYYEDINTQGYVKMTIGKDSRLGLIDVTYSTELGEPSTNNFIGVKLWDNNYFYKKNHEWFYSDNNSLNGSAELFDVLKNSLFRNLDMASFPFSTNRITSTTSDTNGNLQVVYRMIPDKYKLICKLIKHENKYHVTEVATFDRVGLVTELKIKWNEEYTWPIRLSNESYNLNGVERESYSLSIWDELSFENINEDISAFEFMPKVFEDQERYDLTLKKWLD